MQTLLELYDERAIENVIGPETFLPDKVIYLCPKEIAQDLSLQKKLNEYFSWRGHKIQLRFIESSIYKTDHILNQLRRIAAEEKDCALDVTGGTDAALFAAGMFCQETGIATFTYSRKKNRFYNICNAAFADQRQCTLEYKVEDFFRMAGGTLRKGRVDNRILHTYLDTFEPFFQVFLHHRRKWTDAITFIQRISQVPRGDVISLHANGNFVQKGEHGGRISANTALLEELCQIGYLKNLRILPGESVSFDFADEQTRAWLRDVGSVLELYMYKKCLDAGIFGDVISSAIVDWDGTVSHDSVSNEIDVVATRGVIPIFISCKACEVKTEALNELSILRDRFGGKGAKAAIVTTETCNAAARHRAAQLGIAVIDLEELETDRASDRIRVIMKVDASIPLS